MKMKKKESRNSINLIQEELQKYNVTMSEEMKQDLEAPGRKRSSHTSVRLFQILCITIAVAGCIFYFANRQEGNYAVSVYLDQDNLYRKGIDISETEDFRYVGSHLNSDKLTNTIVTTEAEIPGTLHTENEGSLDGDGYMAYSFFIRNAGLKDTGYQASISLNSAFHHSEKALRVKVWRNDEIETCTAKDSDNKVIYCHKVDNFLQGFVDKYTVALWIEKNDPNFRDDMAQAKPQLVIKIDSLQK